MTLFDWQSRRKKHKCHIYGLNALSSLHSVHIRSCSWCRLLRDELKTPYDPPTWLRAAERHQDEFKDLSFSMRFPLAESISPDKLNMIRITCLAKSDAGFADNHVTWES